MSTLNIFWSEAKTITPLPHFTCAFSPRLICRHRILSFKLLCPDILSVSTFVRINCENFN